MRHVFCGDAGKGLEPVGVMGGAVFNSPVLHGFGNHICCGKRKLSAIFHNVNDFLIYILGKSFLHFAECKTLLANKSSKLIISLIKYLFLSRLTTLKPSCVKEPSGCTFLILCLSHYLTLLKKQGEILNVLRIPARHAKPFALFRHGILAVTHAENVLHIRHHA